MNNVKNNKGKGKELKKYLITGATGYIGHLLTEQLLKEANEITVIIRNKDKFESLADDRIHIIEGDICDVVLLDKVEESYDYLIHCAALTRSAYMMSNPVEVADAIVVGTKNMLELATRCDVKSMVYLSSMEVYGKISCENGKRVEESELGQLDINNVRSCYPMAKRMAENYCYLYFKEYGVPVKVARLAQTFGRGVRAEESRIFAQFAASARNNTDIILHTTGNSVGNYCDVDEAIDGILFLLEHGESGEAYNIVNENNTMKIREMAELVANEVAKGKINVKFDIPKDNRFGYAAETGLRLSGAKMKALGWEAKTTLVEMYQKMLKRE